MKQYISNISIVLPGIKILLFRVKLVFVCIFLLGVLRACHVFAVEMPPEPGFAKAGTIATGGIVDLALIYQGGIHRNEWTKEQFQAYLTWMNHETKKEEWLFDGFLFLEFKTGDGVMFTDGYGNKPATRTNWEWYLGRLFEKNKSLDALNDCLTETIDRLGMPSRPHRVVLTVPTPIHGTPDWGVLDGKSLDFTKDSDRCAAIRWFIDQLMERWKAADLNHLELAGFYWVAEKVVENDAAIVKETADYIHGKNKRFYWIPYWRPNVSGKDWKEYGFDIAYQQPNHFFRLNVPDTRLDETCCFSEKYGLGLEMEWDRRLATESGSYVPRMKSYLDVFEKFGAFEKAAMAHYMDGHELHGMNLLKNTSNPEITKLYRRYCKLLAERQKKKYD